MAKKKAAKKKTAKAPKADGLKTVMIRCDRILPKEVNPNKQSDFMFEKERASIREFGFIDPCTVRQHPTKRGYFELVDGEHRWKAAVEEGYTEVPCIDLGKISNARADALTDILNNLKGEQDPALRAQLLKQVLEEDDQLRQVLPYGDDELQTIIEASTYNWNSLNTDNPDKGQGGGSEGGGDSTEQGWVGLKVSLTPQQHKTVSRCLERAKQKLGTKSDAEALTHVCGSFTKR